MSIIALSNTGLIYTSTNGSVWGQIGALSGSVSWKGIISNGSRYLAYGVGASVAWSDDNGANWTSATITNDNWCFGVWTGTKFWLVSQSSGNNYVISSTDGTSWSTPKFIQTNYNPRTIAYNGSALCVVNTGNTSNQITVSTDGGTTWSQYSVGTTPYTGVICKGNQFCLIPQQGYPSAVSTNGTNWTIGTTPIPNYSGIGYYGASNGDTYLIGGSNGNQKTAISTDGLNWTISAAPWTPPAACANVTYDGNMFIAASSTTFGTSTTGISNWNITTLPFTIEDDTGVGAIASHWLEPPKITSFTTGSRSGASQSISISATPSKYGAITDYKVTVDNVDTSWSPAPAPTTVTVPPGTATRTLRAYARKGANSVSAPVAVTISVVDNPPVITAWNVGEPTGPIAPVTLTVTDDFDIAPAAQITVDTTDAPTSWAAPPTSLNLGFKGADARNIGPGTHVLRAWGRAQAGDTVQAAQAKTVTFAEVKPFITSFSLGTPTGLSVPIYLKANGPWANVTNYIISEDNIKPTADDARWAANTYVTQDTPITNFNVSGPGTKTLTAWVKDSRGVVSMYSAGRDVIALPQYQNSFKNPATQTDFAFSATGWSLPQVPSVLKYQPGVLNTHVWAKYTGLSFKDGFAEVTFTAQNSGDGIAYLALQCEGLDTEFAPISTNANLAAVVMDGTSSQFQVYEVVDGAYVATLSGDYGLTPGLNYTFRVTTAGQNMTVALNGSTVGQVTLQEAHAGKVMVGYYAYTSNPMYFHDLLIVSQDPPVIAGPPLVTSFTTGPLSGKTVTNIVINAKNATQYRITTDPDINSVNGSAWTAATFPVTTSYTLPDYGRYNLYVWVRDG